MFQDASNPTGIRIALVTGGLPLGGSTTFLCNLAGELVRRRIPVEVLSFEKLNPLASDFQRLNIPVLCLDDSHFIFEDRVRMVLRRLSEFNPSTVVANLGRSSFEVLRYMPSGVCRAGMVHADDPPVYSMARCYARFLDLIVVISKTIKNNIKSSAEFSKVPIRYLPLGVPIPEDGMVRNFNPGAPLRILYLGRMTQEQKRVLLFPKILENLKSSGIPFHWTLAGEGSEKTVLEQTMKNTPEQTVCFVGKISYEQVPEVMRAHDIFLLASEYEGLPLTLLEAMGHGLVPVVSDLPSGIPEVVDETNGIRVSVADMAGYARAIIHLHENREELAAKSVAARERVKTKFSVEAMTDRWLAVLPKISPKAEWPMRWKIQAVLGARHPIYFSPPMRVLRRLAMRFRS